MKRDQMYMIGSFLISAVVLVGGYFLGISPLLAQAALTDADRVVAEAQATGYQATLASLKEKYTKIDALKTEVAAARATIPGNADMSRFVGGLDLIAQSTGAQVLEVTVTDALPYAPPVVIAPAVPAEAPAETADAAATAAPADSAPVVAINPLIPNGNLVNNANMAIIPVTISVSGTFDQNMAFVGSLQKGARIFLVTGLSTAQDTADGLFNTDIAGYVYVVLTADAAVPTAPDATVAAG